MPPIPLRHDDVGFPLLKRTIELIKRASDHGNISKAHTIGAGVLVVFCLLGATLGLIAWWLFIRRSGFIWHDYDWAEYKASVLRRPEERPDDAITVFSDGTARKGGPQGSSVGARTVVLGELDTTYTKSYVSHEKPWGPRDLPTEGGPKRKGLLGTAINDVAESVLGRLRGGGPPDENDTIVQRNKSLRRSRHRNSKRERHKSHHKSRRHRHRYEEDSDVDTQLPAPPLTDLTSSSAAAPAPLPRKQPTRMPSKRQRSTQRSTQRHREPSYAIGDDRAGGGARYHRHRRTESAAAEESSSSDSSSDDSSTDSDDSSSDEESEIGPSEIGLGQGNKVYHHPITQDRLFWGNARPVERNGGGAGGTYGGGAPALMAPGPSRGRGGYRAASVGSLSSEGSVRSSNAGR
jgi:hypothetical protein